MPFRVVVDFRLFGLDLGLLFGPLSILHETQAERPVAQRFCCHVGSCDVGEACFFVIRPIFGASWAELLRKSQCVPHHSPTLATTADIALLVPNFNEDFERVGFVQDQCHSKALTGARTLPFVAYWREVQ